MGEADRRILVTDDDDAIRALLLTILRRRGFKVDTARNGIEALEHIRRCRYSLVVLDLMMPMMSGYQFLEELEGLDRGIRPLVLVFTAGPPAKALNPDLVAGAIRKPFDIELLVDTITACVATAGDRTQGPDCPSSDSGTAVSAGSGEKPN